MAILVIYRGKGLNKKDYDALRKEVNWETDQPEGALIHIAALEDSGDIIAVDVWDSQEELNNFVGTRLMPAIQKRNLPQPEVSVYPTHNINAFAGIDDYVID